jgi:hypothetical protein
MSNQIIGRRREQKERFVQVRNTMLEDNRLSWKAKGLLAYLVSRPDGWVVRMSDLTNRSTDGEKSIRAATKELREFGYLVFHKIKENGKFVGTVWEYDDEPFVEPSVEPLESPCADFGHVENGDAENGNAQKGIHINKTNSINTDSNKTKDTLVVDRSTIISELATRNPDKPVQEIADALLSDKTATIDTDKQFKSLLAYRIKNYKVPQDKPSKSSQRRSKSSRPDTVSSGMETWEYPSEQPTNITDNTDLAQSMVEKLKAFRSI